MAGQDLTLAVFLHCPLELLLKGLSFGNGPNGWLVHRPGEQAFTSWHPKFYSALTGLVCRLLLGGGGSVPLAKFYLM